jgi:putative transposase
MKPICERVNGALRRDPLDRVLIIGERHLALVLREYAAHYNGRRPHPSPGDGGPRIGRRSQSGTWQTCGPCVENLSSQE